MMRMDFLSCFKRIVGFRFSSFGFRLLAGPRRDASIEIQIRPDCRRSDDSYHDRCFRQWFSTVGPQRYFSFEYDQPSAAVSRGCVCFARAPGWGEVSTGDKPWSCHDDVRCSFCCFTASGVCFISVRWKHRDVGPRCVYHVRRFPMGNNRLVPDMGQAQRGSTRVHGLSGSVDFLFPSPAQRCGASFFGSRHQSRRHYSVASREFSTRSMGGSRSDVNVRVQRSESGRCLFFNFGLSVALLGKVSRRCQLSAYCEGGSQVMRRLTFDSIPL